MTYQTFLKDAPALRDRGDWLVELHIKDPDDQPVVLRYSRRGTVLGMTDVTVDGDTIPAHTRFEKRLTKAPSIKQTLWKPGHIMGGSLPAAGSLQLRNADGKLDKYRPIEGYRWAGGLCKVYHCDTANVPGTIGKVLEAEIGPPRSGVGKPFEVPLLSRDSAFDVKLSERVYRGGGYMLELSGDRTVSYGSPSKLNITGSLTLEAWIWIDVAFTGEQQVWGWLGGTPRPWRLNILASGQFRVRATSAAGVTQDAISTVALGVRKPYHLAAVINGRDLTYYVWDDDAETLTVEAYTNVFSSATRDANTGGTVILRSASDATGRIWFDEMRVWQGLARSEADIAGDRFRPIPAGAIPASLVHYTRMDDGTGTTVVDSAASPANGTISGAGTSTWLWTMEGTAELAGTPKPDGWGRKFGARPVLVDPVRSGYQVVGGGSAQGYSSFEGGLGHTMLASAADFRTFLTTTPTAGNCLPYYPRGYFKLGANAVLPVAATLQGYNGGPLGYVETGADVMRDLVTRRGPKLADPADLDTAAFTALDAAATAPLGFWVDDQKSLRAMLDFVSGSIQSWWGYLRGSTLFTAAQFLGPAGSAAFAFDERHVVKVEDLPPADVVYQVVVRYQQSHVVLSENQVAQTIKGTEAWQRWTKEWLEAPQTDWDIRAKYPGKSSVSLTFDTALYYEADANALAVQLLALLKGQHDGLAVTLRAPAFEVSPGDTATLRVVMQNGVVRLGLDGARRWIFIGLEDNRFEGLVSGEVWR